MNGTMNGAIRFQPGALDAMPDTAATACGLLKKTSIRRLTDERRA